MKKRSTVILTGALAGGLLGIALLVLFIGRFAMGATELTGNGDGAISVTTGALYLATVAVALISGSVVSAAAYGASSAADDQTSRFELAHILPFGLVTAVAAGYAILRAGLGISADIQFGVVTVRAADLALTTLVSGLVTGGLVSWVVSTLAAKSVVGLEGEAAPANTGEMLKAAASAISGPMLAIAVIAILAIAFAQLLLAAEGTAAIALFGGAAAVVVLVAAAAAYMGGSNDKSS